MSKIKPSVAPHYELLVLISNQYSEDEVKPIMEKVRAIIDKREGKIIASEDWGKKRLAYPIKNFRYGYYQLLELELSGEAVAKIDRDLRMASEVLRHQITVKKIRSAAAIAKDKKIAEKIAAKNLKEEKIAKEQEKTTDKSKVDLKDLDAKLDKILETDDLL